MLEKNQVGSMVREFLLISDVHQGISQSGPLALVSIFKYFGRGPLLI